VIVAGRKLLLTAIALSAGLSACSIGGGSGGCKDNPRYQTTEVEAPLKVPSGLQVPESGGELPLPTGPRSAVSAGPGGECLENPPRFFAASGSPAEEGLPLAREAEPIGGVSIPGVTRGSRIQSGTDLRRVGVDERSGQFPEQLGERLERP
jgi:hypothetical protein